MKFKTTKSESVIASQLPDGFQVETELVDGSLKSVTLRSPAGILRFAEESYSMRVAIPAPPKMVKKFKLEGQVGSLPKIEEVFKERYEARERRDALVSELSCEDLAFEITEVEVEEEK